jgi:hypothetical protein
VDTIRIDGMDYVVSRAKQARRPLVVNGPLPLVARSPLLMRVRHFAPVSGRVGKLRSMRAGWLLQHPQV